MHPFPEDIPHLLVFTQGDRRELNSRNLLHKQTPEPLGYDRHTTLILRSHGTREIRTLNLRFAKPLRSRCATAPYSIQCSLACIDWMQERKVAPSQNYFFIRHERRESNPVIKVLETFAFPSGSAHSFHSQVTFKRLCLP